MVYVLQPLGTGIANGAQLATHPRANSPAQLTPTRFTATPTSEHELPFPCEIFLTIFSHFRTTDGNTVSIATLENLTLTCKAFCELAQSFLFESSRFIVNTAYCQPHHSEFECETTPLGVQRWRRPVESTIKPLNVYLLNETKRKLAFASRDRIAPQLQSFHLIPAYYPAEDSTITNFCSLEYDFRKHTVVETFFREVLPRLVHLKHLTLTHVTLRTSHILQLQATNFVLQSLHLKLCCVLEDVNTSLQGCIVALPVKHLTFCGITVSRSGQSLCPLLPHPAHIETLSYKLMSIPTSSAEAHLLSRLMALGKFGSLRSLEIDVDPCGAVSDWRPFLSSCCPSLKLLSISQKDAYVKMNTGSAATLISLDMFCGTWNDVKLYAQGLAHIKHLEITGEHPLGVSHENGHSRDDIHPFSSVASLEALRDGLRERFAHLVSLELSIQFVSTALVHDLVESCPHLRALKINGKYQDIGLLVLSDVLITVTRWPAMEYLSLPIIYLSQEESRMIDETVSSLSPLLRALCPKLRCVEVNVGIFLPVDAEYNIQFDLFAGRRMAKACTIHEWRSCVM
ncbi:hypothetical protein BKA93DRAFT_191420 [Sparassis latifolia]